MCIIQLISILFVSVKVSKSHRKVNNRVVWIFITAVVPIHGIKFQLLVYLFRLTQDKFASETYYTNVAVWHCIRRFIGDIKINLLFQRVFSVSSNTRLPLLNSPFTIIDKTINPPQRNFNTHTEFRVIAVSIDALFRKANSTAWYF